jgi:diguanylate cyclase (GGDEF)-like protein
MLSRHLERAGWVVNTAGSIEEARKTLDITAWDVVILDRNLPDGDGLMLCAEIRQSRPDGYIMILTGDDREDAKVQGFDHGADDYVTKPFQTDEFIARVRAGLRIVDLQKRLLDSNRRLEEMSLTDDMTGLRNRRAFDRELQARFDTARRYGRPLSIAMVDVDYFKSINDTLGHSAGDAVLRWIGSVLTRATRRTDFAARIGGEEFAVILPETGLFEALQFGEKLRANVASAPIEGNATTISVGVATMPLSQFETAEEFLFAADAALYRAKEGGRNRVEAEKRETRFARRFEVETAKAECRVTAG